MASTADTADTTHTPDAQPPEPFDPARLRTHILDVENELNDIAGLLTAAAYLAMFVDEQGLPGSPCDPPQPEQGQVTLAWELHSRFNLLRDWWHEAVTLLPAAGGRRHG